MVTQSKSLPSIKFTTMPIKKEVDWMYGFLFYNKWGWEKRIIKIHPTLKPIFRLDNEEKRKLFLYNYIANYRIKNKFKILKQVDNYKKKWIKKEKNCFKTLSLILGTSWPNDHKIIKAFISLNPICPRFLSTWSFSLFYNQTIEQMHETICHEACHFLYFKKWVEIFPVADRKTFDYPHIEWHLSEILTPIILNDFRMQNILRHKASFYSEHENIIIDRKKATIYFSNLYNDYINKDCNFDKFIKEAYKIINENKDSFKF